MKVLIAEDDTASRMLLEHMVTKLGHEVVAVKDGMEAWKAFQKEHIPVLVSDWMMPRMDGPDLCRRIRAADRTRYTYIIVLTALGGKSNYLEGMNAGADDFVTKPVDVDQLAARLRVAERVLSLQAEVRQLAGLLPICMYCKRIRSDDNQWIAIEQYVAERTDASFSHGLCPECYAVHVKPQLRQHREESE